MDKPAYCKVCGNKLGTVTKPTPSQPPTYRERKLPPVDIVRDLEDDED